MAGTMDLTGFKELMLATCGHSFGKDREQTLLSGLLQRMTSRGIDTPEAYHALLLRDGDELLQLVGLLTVNETYFYREPEHLKLVSEKLLPELMAERNNRPVRILSAGCSTGEEPYSIAMMLRDRFGADSERLFAITGVDIDSGAIAAARKGVYGKGSFRGMDNAVLERHFEPVGPGSFQVKDSVRQQVVFEMVNLLGSSYPNRMHLPDIIFYRNVSIYFPEPVQREIFGRLAGLLNEGGFLLVGATETIHHDVGILSLTERDSLFYYRKTPPLVFKDRRTANRNSALTEELRNRPRQSGPVHAAKQKSAQKQTSVGHVQKQPQSFLQEDMRESFDTALKFARNNQPDAALGILEDIVKHDKTFAKAYSLKGSLLLSASRFDEAQSVCDFVLSLDPLCLEAYLMLGIIARHKGSDDDAFRRFREAIYLDPSCWLAHFYTAEILSAQRDIKRARSSYEAAVRLLEKGSVKEHGEEFFPLSFNAEQFIVVCRHKLSLLAP
jgi:chemotaxis protein methyltransferase CheR